MLLSQPSLGKLMGVDGQSIARREKSGRIPKWANRFIRLIYFAKANGQEPIQRAIERVTIVERLVKQKILVEEARGRWKSEVTEEAVSA